MRKILIVYSSKHSQTQKIANRLATILSKSSYKVEVLEINNASTESVADYDAVVIGGSVYIGQYSRHLKKWLKHHAGELDQTYTAFFSVCLGILQKETGVQSEERRFVGDLFRRTNWYPQIWTIFAGAISYSKYNWFIKRVMQNIAKKTGGSTDTTRDHDYTNWDDVEKFVKNILFDLQSIANFRGAIPQEANYHGTSKI